MEENKIAIGVNQEKNIQIPSRGSSGLKMVFTITDSTVASVTRKEIKPSDIDSLNLRPGDPVPAIWIIKGLKTGTTKIHFAELRPGMNDGPGIPLKDFDVTVTD